MDATYTSILRLWEQGLTRNQIADRLDISKQKVSRVLITSGAIETEESALYNQGCTVEQIMQQLGKSRKAVVTRLPYLRGMYDAEYPTPNAIRIRRWREKQH